MPVNIGPVVRRLRERWRLTQQELVEYTGLDRSASYISSIETGKTSPTLQELDALARVFRTTAVEMIEEASGTGGGSPPRERDSEAARVATLLESLSASGRTLALELLDLLAERDRRLASSEKGKERAAE
ncbi:MAG: helix-turn-helix domain-containing protein [Chloroflexi bacterium]|nr:helix-turn-helix domain-containing protein [Chloroflexota bacterium]